MISTGQDLTLSELQLLAMKCHSSKTLRVNAHLPVEQYDQPKKAPIIDVHNEEIKGLKRMNICVYTEKLH